jgi:hypothetical protein
MFLKKENLLKEIPILFGILVYAYLINWFSGNIGIIPIDSFGFLDSGHSILKGSLPIRDFWIFTGLLVDYMEALFLFLLGNNWNSHLAHGSFMNLIATIGVYLFLRELRLSRIYVIFYSICFATLCYPVSGTPFAYLHAYIFSLLAMFNLILAIKHRNKFLWFFFPFICFFAFLSMQAPTAYILIILFILLVYYFIKNQDVINLKYFIFGSVLSFGLFWFFLYITNTPIINFIYQYILFPLTIGEARISSDKLAYVGLIDQLNFKRLIGEFKWMHIFLIPLILISIKNRKKNIGFLNIVNFTIILCVLAFFFNQLITANQIYIFSLIPILAAILHINLIKLDFNPKLYYLIFFIVLLTTVKYHYRFNVDRKFLDLENIDKSNAVSANLIHKNFNNLKWVSKFDEPNNEVEILKKAVSVIENDKREKVLLTHYQFMSTILDTNLNILNRWYLWNNNTHPTENHKYFEFYKSMINKNIQSNNVKVIYLLGQKNEFLFDKVKNYFTDVCFESKIIIQGRFSSHKIINCKN